MSLVTCWHEPHRIAFVAVTARPAHQGNYTCLPYALVNTNQPKKVVERSVLLHLIMYPRAVAPVNRFF